MEITEKKVSHTPGPWSIEYGNSDDRSGGQWFEVGPAKVEFSYGSTKEVEMQAEVDAKLIAAAPELLRATRSLMLSMAAHPDCEDGSEFADFVSLAQEAIKKATE